MQSFGKVKNYLLALRNALSFPFVVVRDSCCSPFIYSTRASDSPAYLYIQEREIIQKLYTCLQQSLAFCSLRAKVDNELANVKLGVYTYCIHGVVHHSIGRLIPEVGEQPKFAQIYIHDGTADAELETARD